MRRTYRVLQIFKHVGMPLRCRPRWQLSILRDGVYCGMVTHAHIISSLIHHVVFLQHISTRFRGAGSPSYCCASFRSFATSSVYDPLCSHLQTFISCGEEYLCQGSGSRCFPVASCDTCHVCTLSPHTVYRTIRRGQNTNWKDRTGRHAFREEYGWSERLGYHKLWRYPFGELRSVIHQ